MDESATKRRPSVRQLSKTPSWVMLGFLLGAACVWTLRRPEPPTRMIVVTRPAEAAPTVVHQGLNTIESVFGIWDRFAVWDGEVSQVAMWNPASRDFSDAFEVRRINGICYFRSLPRLTNRLLRHGKLPPPECPLRFTESEEQYRDWVEHGRFEQPLDPLPPSVAPSAAEMPRPSLEVRPMTPPAPATDSLPKR